MKMPHYSVPRLMVGLHLPKQSHNKLDATLEAIGSRILSARLMILSNLLTPETAIVNTIDFVKVPSHVTPNCFLTCMQAGRHPSTHLIEL